MDYGIRSSSTLAQALQIFQRAAMHLGASRNKGCCGSVRRRTPGLRREQAAQRANISPTWYTWLEQGRGGAPSADVLDRIAGALMLTDLEREHLYLPGLGRAPEVKYNPADGITPRLQRVLNGMAESPAIIRNAIWDVVAWNRAV
jgi:transcriptional regulator with XRE-family HTH domain